ncbi:hypothetical protein B5X24_HaOG205366 [Helicoverpa armigera]|nr:hypothetical protein B5X24_HaOG205366 [Helicoverpa armigera]
MKRNKCFCSFVTSTSLRCAKKFRKAPKFHSETEWFFFYWLTGRSQGACTVRPQGHRGRCKRCALARNDPRDLRAPARCNPMLLLTTTPFAFNHAFMSTDT